MVDERKMWRHVFWGRTRRNNLIFYFQEVSSSFLFVLYGSRDEKVDWGCYILLFFFGGGGTMFCSGKHYHLLFRWTWYINKCLLVLLCKSSFQPVLSTHSKAIDEVIKEYIFSQVSLSLSLSVACFFFQIAIALLLVMKFLIVCACVSCFCFRI